MSREEHVKGGPACVPCAIVTVSDSRTAETDGSGRAICAMLEAAGHPVCDYRIVRDEPEEIRAVVETFASQSGCGAILVNGGTGISPRDRTYEAIVELLEQRLDGFGELFRMLSYQEIGPSAMLSRAVGGIIRGKPLFCMPGSTGAVRLAMERLILPELTHLASLLGRR